MLLSIFRLTLEHHGDHTPNFIFLAFLLAGNIDVKISRVQFSIRLINLLEVVIYNHKSWYSDFCCCRVLTIIIPALLLSIITSLWSLHFARGLLHMDNICLKIIVKKNKTSLPMTGYGQKYAEFDQKR